MFLQPSLVVFLRYTFLVVVILFAESIIADCDDFTSTSTSTHAYVPHRQGVADCLLSFGPPPK